MKSIPGINILTPSDKQELVIQLRESVLTNKPTYMRIGKKGEPDIFQSKHNIGIGRANLISEGQDILIIAIGPIVSEALEASKILKNLGINIGVATMGSIRPLDEDFLKTMVQNNYKKWITLKSMVLMED